MWTKTHLANLSLANLNSTAFISDLDSEQSTEVNLCRAFMDVVLEEAFGRYQWTFNKKVAPLQLIAANPTTEWLFAYAEPNDCIDFRRIQGDMRVLNSDTIVRCSPGLYGPDDKKVIFTDRPSAIGEYSIIPNLNACPADFIRATSYSLSASIAGGIAAGARANTPERMFGIYETLAFQAATRDSNQATQDQSADAEAIRARGGY